MTGTVPSPIYAPTEKALAQGASSGILGTIISLYSVQTFVYIVPLLTLPYLSRVLSPLEWGALAFAEAYARYISLTIEYGFGLSATREVSAVRSDPAARSRELAGVLGAQMILAAASFLLTLGLLSLAPQFAAQKRFFPGALLLAMGQAFSPLWYFQGIERVKLMAAINVAGNILGAAGIFIAVRGPGQGSRALLVRGGAAVAATLAGILIAYMGTPFVWPSIAGAIKSLRQGGTLFLSRNAVHLYTTMNVLLVGIVSTPLAVAWYAGAEKLVKAAIAANGPLSQAFYPRINGLLSTNRSRAAGTARVAALAMISLGVALSASLYAAAPVLVRLALGARFVASVPVLRTLSILPFATSVSNAFGIQWMLSLRLDRQFAALILGAGAFNIGAALVLGRAFQAQGVAASVALAECIVAGGSILVLRWYRQEPWRDDPDGKNDLVDLALPIHQSDKKR